MKITVYSKHKFIKIASQRDYKLAKNYPSCFSGESRASILIKRAYNRCLYYCIQEKTKHFTTPNPFQLNDYQVSCFNYTLRLYYKVKTCEKYRL